MVSRQDGIRLRLFGLRGRKMSRVESESFPLSPELTVGKLWAELQGTSEPHSLLARLQRDAVLALVNGVPVQRLAGWETRLVAGDTVTLMVKAFGG